jgi:hypothetical protein
MLFLRSLILSLLLALGSHSPEIFAQQEVFLNNEVEHASFKIAQQATEKVAFEIKSTKFGMVTTSVEGFVLKYKVKANIDWNKSVATNLRLEMYTQFLNTDSESRDEKMWNHCLDYKNQGEMAVNVEGPVAFTAEAKEYPAKIWIRGKEFPIKVTLNLEKTSEGVKSKGMAILSFKQLEIPDPSIMIASVDDRINVSFQVELKK